MSFLLSREKEVDISNAFLVLGSALIIFLGVSLIIQCLLFILGYTLTNISLFIGFILAIIVIFITPEPLKYSRVTRIIFAFSFCVLLIVVVISVSHIFDISWDGRDYHQKAIVRLIRGWNPIYQPLTPKDLYYNVWLNHYPKGAWIIFSLFAQITQNIEAGKSFHVLLMASLFFLALSLFLRANVGFVKSLLLSLLITLNPVSVVQSLTFYVDGLVASSFTLTLVIYYLALQRKIPPWLFVVDLLCIFSIGMNVKFTGTIYLGIIITGAMLLFYLIKSANFEIIIKSTIMSLIVAVFVVGAAPYVTNTLSYGNPLYPTLGKSNFDMGFVMGGQMPSNLKNLSRVEKLFVSIFSKSQNIYADKIMDPLKLPWTITKSELATFSVPDTRIGGWGPFFGLALIISFVVCWYMVRSRSAMKYYWGVTLGLILVTVLINPEAWWARYTPQIWLIPVLTLVYYFLTNIRRGKIFANILAGVLLLNVFLVLGVNLHSNITSSRYMNNQLQLIQKKNKMIYVFFGPLDATETTLNYYHIHYEVVNNPEQLKRPKILSPGVYYSMKLK